ncbi:hypothetical protein RI054_09g48040 [Pseudoscourfieldia marina]
MEAEEADDPFVESALTIVAAVPHVCGLERANKDVDIVYTRRRNRMSTSKMNANLYVRVNKNVLNRLSSLANARKKKKDRPLASASASANTSDGEDNVFRSALDSDSDVNKHGNPTPTFRRIEDIFKDYFENLETIKTALLYRVVDKDKYKDILSTLDTKSNMPTFAIHLDSARTTHCAGVTLTTIYLSRHA